MAEYKVITDEEFFNEFKYMSERVRVLGGLFQNEGAETNSEHIAEWIEIYNNLLDDLKTLKAESIGRFQLNR